MGESIVEVQWANVNSLNIAERPAVKEALSAISKKEAERPLTGNDLINLPSGRIYDLLEITGDLIPDHEDYDLGGEGIWNKGTPEDYREWQEDHRQATRDFLGKVDIKAVIKLVDSKLSQKLHDFLEQYQDDFSRFYDDWTQENQKKKFVPFTVEADTRRGMLKKVRYLLDFLHDHSEFGEQLSAYCLEDLKPEERKTTLLSKLAKISEISRQSETI